MARSLHVLTVEEILPSLEGWESLGTIDVGSAVAGLVPFTHFNEGSLDTFLDHIAISHTLDEVFDNPIRVMLADGTEDLLPGIGSFHRRSRPGGRGRRCRPTPPPARGPKKAVVAAAASMLTAAGPRTKSAARLAFSSSEPLGPGIDDNGASVTES